MSNTELQKRDHAFLVGDDQEWVPPVSGLENVESISRDVESERASSDHDTAEEDHEADSDQVFEDEAGREDTNATDIVRTLDELMETYLQRIGVNEDGRTNIQRQGMDGETTRSLEAELILRQCIREKWMETDGDDSARDGGTEAQFYRMSTRPANGRKERSDFGILADQLERGIRRSMKKLAKKKAYKSSDYTEHWLRMARHPRPL